MNKLLVELSKELKKVNLDVACTKETMTLLHCYLYDLDDCKVNGIVKDYTGCKKLYVMYKKEDLVKMSELKTLNNFAKLERETYDMANKANMLGRKLK